MDASRLRPTHSLPIPSIDGVGCPRRVAGRLGLATESRWELDRLGPVSRQLA